MAENQGTFNLDQWLQDNGLEFAGKGESPSMPLVKDNTGQVRKLDVQAIISDLGGDPNNIIRVDYNSPKTALQESPVDAKERAKLSVGNIPGSINYLKKKFEDAVYDEEQGLTVKKDGVWHAIDPSLLGHGSAWDKTKEMVKHGFGLINNPDLAGDIAELGPEAINAVTTQVAGKAGESIGSLAGPAGAVAGRAAGVAYGGAVSGAIRTSLGRMAGTYEATPEEQTADIGMEALLSLGGEVVAVGAKPGLGKLVNASKNIARSASEGTKDAISAVVGKMTNAGYPAVRAMLDMPGEVGAAMNSALREAGHNVGKAIDHVATMKRNATEQLLEAATDALPRKYGQMLDKLVQQAGSEGFVVDFKTVVGDAFKNLQEEGFGRSGSRVLKITDPETGEVTKQELNKFFRFFTQRQFVKQSVQGGEVELLNAEERASLRPIIRLMEQFSEVGTLKGESAANVLKNFEKNFTKLTKRAFESNNPEYQRIVAKLNGSFKKAVSKTFDSQGLGEQHAALAELYGQYGDAVSNARKILQSDRGLETLTNQLTSPPGRNTASKSLRDGIASLLGDKGEVLVNNITKLHAAEKLLPRAPSLGLFQIGTAAGMANAVGGPALGTAVAATGIAGSSPRFMGRAIQYAKQPMDATTRTTIAVGNHALDFLKARTPEQLKQLVSNDDLFKAFVRPLITSQAQESQMRDQLMSIIEGNSQQQ